MSLLSKGLENAIQIGCGYADDHPDAAILGGIVGAAAALTLGLAVLPGVLAGIAAASAIAESTKKK